MSRSGYSDDLDPLELGRWRAQVASAIRGKRGQAFLRDLIAALDAMADKRLVRGHLRVTGLIGPYDPPLIVGADELVSEHGGALPMGSVCALGAVAVARKIDVDKIDPYDHDTIAAKIDIAGPLAQEVAYINDECGPYRETPEARFVRMRKWAESHIKESK